MNEDETRILRKGVKYIIEDEDKLTPTEDLYMVTVIKDSKVLLRRLFDNPIFAGKAVRSLEAFYNNLVDDF